MPAEEPPLPLLPAGDGGLVVVMRGVPARLLRLLPSMLTVNLEDGERGWRRIERRLLLDAGDGSTAREGGVRERGSLLPSSIEDMAAAMFCCFTNSGPLKLPMLWPPVGSSLIRERSC